MIDFLNFMRFFKYYRKEFLRIQLDNRIIATDFLFFLEHVYLRASKMILLISNSQKFFLANGICIKKIFTRLFIFPLILSHYLRHRFNLCVELC